MDLTRIIDMVINAVLRRLINKGVDAGINRLTGAQPGAKTPLTPEEREARELAKRAKMAAKLTRRL